jgi:REP-associated tyrosine transposase
MTTPKRHGAPPGTYFVSSRTWESRALFVKEPMCAVFTSALFGYREKGFFLLHAFVLMPDHFHLLLTPSAETTLERGVQYIKGGSAHAIGKELDLRFPVWQRGFSDHRVRDAEDFALHVRYIEQNPVKRRLVASACDYAWSSAFSRFHMDEPPQRLKPPVISMERAVRHG